MMKERKGARLDCVLCNMEWKTNYPDALQQHLPMVQSNHASLLIHTEMQNNARRSHHFRFQVAWMTHPDLHRVIESNWKDNADFFDNINNVVYSLSRWNIDVFGHIPTKKRRIQDRIDGIQRHLSHKFCPGLFKTG